jgi:Domain of unknown function (DUF6766)
MATAMGEDDVANLLTKNLEREKAALSRMQTIGKRLAKNRAKGSRAAVIGWGSYLTRSDFWESTLQNWQSEFLAVGSMAVFTIYLRQRGSPESKPVGAPHHETSSSG